MLRYLTVVWIASFFFSGYRFVCCTVVVFAFLLPCKPSFAEGKEKPHLGNGWEISINDGVDDFFDGGQFYTLMKNGVDYYISNRNGIDIYQHRLVILLKNNYVLIQAEALGSSGDKAITLIEVGGATPKVVARIESATVNFALELNSSCRDSSAPFCVDSGGGLDECNESGCTIFARLSDKFSYDVLDVLVPIRMEYGRVRFDLEKEIKKNCLNDYSMECIFEKYRTKMLSKKEALDKFSERCVSSGDRCRNFNAFFLGFNSLSGLKNSRYSIIRR